jgi:hypothetical protein
MSCHIAFADFPFPACFPFVCNCCLCLFRICVSNIIWPFYLWHAAYFLILFPFCSLFDFNIFFFCYCAVGGRLSLYSFSWHPLIIPLRSVPTKYRKCTTPLSVIDFTSYGPSQCILSFPGC